MVGIGALGVMDSPQARKSFFDQTSSDTKHHRNPSAQRSLGINVQTSGASQIRTVIKPGETSRQYKDEQRSQIVRVATNQARAEEARLLEQQKTNSARPRLFVDDYGARQNNKCAIPESTSTPSRSPPAATSLKHAFQTKQLTTENASDRTKSNKIIFRAKSSSNNVSKQPHSIPRGATKQPVLGGASALGNWHEKFGNKTASKSLGKGAASQYSISPKVVDLVSDEEDYDGDEIQEPTNARGSLADNASSLYRYRPTLDTESGERHDSFQELIGPANELDSYVLIDRIYLGKRQLSTENTPLSKSDIKISARITNAGLQLDLPSTFKFTNAAKSKGIFEHEDLAAVLTVPSCEINRSYASSADRVGSTFYLAFDLLGAASENASLSKHVSVGTGKSLDPGSKNLLTCPAQYILLVITGLRSSERFKTLSRQLHSCVSHFRVKSVQNVTNVQLFVESASSTLKFKWNEEAEAEMIRTERSTQRAKRRRSTASSTVEIGEQEGDNDTYLVYPCNLSSAAVAAIVDESTSTLTHSSREPDKERDKRICITKGDMRRLDPPIYLNDTIIDFKILHMLLNEYSSRRKQVHCFQSFFYTRLNDERSVEDGFKNVATWTKAVDIFEKEMLILPVNHTSHWSALFLLRPNLLLAPATSEEVRTATETSVGASEPRETACILCLDSLDMHNTKSIASKTKGYLLEEFLHKKCGSSRIDPKFSAFKAAVEALPVVAMKDIPTQANGYDCGMYVIKYVEVFLNRWPRSTLDTIKKKFSGLFSGEDKCSEDDITLARVQMRSLLEQIKVRHTGLCCAADMMHTSSL
jgi:Ulp1 family protease